MLAVCSLGGYAQGDVTFLDWDFITQDTVLPMYSEVIPLDAKDNVSSYRVTLRYPVWARPTKSEMALIRRHKRAISREIAVDSYVSTCRDRRMLNYSFVPVIHRNGRYLKLVSAEIHIEALDDEASQSRQAACATLSRQLGALVGQVAQDTHYSGWHISSQLRIALAGRV